MNILKRVRADRGREDGKDKNNRDRQLFHNILPVTGRKRHESCIGVWRALIGSARLADVAAKVHTFPVDAGQGVIGALAG